MKNKKIIIALVFFLSIVFVFSYYLKVVNKKSNSDNSVSSENLSNTREEKSNKIIDKEEEKDNKINKISQKSNFEGKVLESGEEFISENFDIKFKISDSLKSEIGILETEKRILFYEKNKNERFIKTDEFIEFFQKDSDKNVEDFIVENFIHETQSESCKVMTFDTPSGIFAEIRVDSLLLSQEKEKYSVKGDSYRIEEMICGFAAYSDKNNNYFFAPSGNRLFFIKTEKSNFFDKNSLADL